MYACHCLGAIIFEFTCISCQIANLRDLAHNFQKLKVCTRLPLLPCNRHLHHGQHHVKLVFSAPLSCFILFDMLMIFLDIWIVEIICVTLFYFFKCKLIFSAISSSFVNKWITLQYTIVITTNANNIKK